MWVKVFFLQAGDIIFWNQLRKGFQFYMGRNTPARREYIMSHLVVEEAL